jgi:hypothetical protein
LKLYQHFFPSLVFLITMNSENFVTSVLKKKKKNHGILILHSSSRNRHDTTQPQTIHCRRRPSTNRRSHRLMCQIIAWSSGSRIKEKSFFLVKISFLSLLLNIVVRLDYFDLTFITHYKVKLYSQTIKKCFFI